MTFVAVCSVTDVPVGQVRAFEVNGRDIAIVHTEDEVFAIHDECSHGSVPLSDGDVFQCSLECVAHGSRFDLRTGRPLEPPAVAPVPVFPVQILDDQVHVDLDNPLVTTQES